MKQMLTLIIANLHKLLNTCVSFISTVERLFVFCFAGRSYTILQSCRRGSGPVKKQIKLDFMLSPYSEKKARIYQQQVSKVLDVLDQGLKLKETVALVALKSLHSPSGLKMFGHCRHFQCDLVFCLFSFYFYNDVTLCSRILLSTFFTLTLLKSLKKKIICRLINNKNILSVQPDFPSTIKKCNCI